jgi:zinc transporter ZupT
MQLWQVAVLALLPFAGNVAGGMLVVLAVGDIVPEAHEGLEDFPLTPAPSSPALPSLP